MPDAIIAHEIQKIKKTGKIRSGYEPDYRRTKVMTPNKKMIDAYRKALSKIQHEEIEVPPYKRRHFDFIMENTYLPDQVLTVFLW